MIKHSYWFLFVSALFLPLAAHAAPTISEVSPVTAAAGTPVTLSATVNSSIAIQTCRLYVDLEDVGEMSVNGTLASRSYTFPAGGSRIAFVFCRDTASGMGAGPNTAIWATGAIQNSAPLSAPPSNPPTQQPAQNPTSTPTTPPSVTRRLIKTACPAHAAADDPCKAVYYVGADGKRHAYPNGAVFFTWYANFDSVETVTSGALSAYQLGANVTYRPGARMVKFTTLDRVYAVGSGGTLRWVKTEDTARSLYGSDWNKKIDDIPDAFFANYTFGADVDAATAFSPASEMTQSATFD